MRLLKGDIVERGRHKLPGYELLVIVKEGARAAFAPYSVNKPYEDFARWYDGLYNIDIGPKPCKWLVNSRFPPESEDKAVLLDPSKMSEEELSKRFDDLTVWVHEVLAMIGTLEGPIKGKALAQAAKFLDVPEQAVAPPRRC